MLFVSLFFYVEVLYNKDKKRFVNARIEKCYKNSSTVKEWQKLWKGPVGKNFPRASLNYLPPLFLSPHICFFVCQTSGWWHLLLAPVRRAVSTVVRQWIKWIKQTLCACRWEMGWAEILCILPLFHSANLRLMTAVLAAGPQIMDAVGETNFMHLCCWGGLSFRWEG